MNEFATLEERKKDSFQQIMFDSISRNDEIDHICKEISRLTGMKISPKNKERIKNVLGWFDIEDGVTVFTASPKPDDKGYIGKADLGDEIMYFYFGPNRKCASWDKYAVGITVKSKSDHELCEYTEATLQENFPKLYEEMIRYIYLGDINQIYTLAVYPTAGMLYKEVKNRRGKWLVQVPDENGGFVPNKGIGLFNEENMTFYIFEPKPKCIRNKPYVKKFKFVND